MQVLDASMECLASAAVADLPLLLKFIVQQVTSKNGVEVGDSLCLCLCSTSDQACLLSDHRGSEGET